MAAGRDHEPKSLIKERNPDQLQLPGFLWTRDAVLELIDQRFGIRLAVTTVGRYLRAWGLTPQVPARRALERDPEAVKEWLEVRYPRLVARARRPRAGPLSRCPDRFRRLAQSELAEEYAYRYLAAARVHHTPEEAPPADGSV